MNSTRDAYKAKLREGSTRASRRKSRGDERKISRNNEINKRRPLLSNDMSPVIEKFETETQSQAKAKKDLRKEKTDNVLERLQRWREEKKTRRGQEKAKPVFKTGGLARDSEAELFRGEANVKKSGKEMKVVPKPSVKPDAAKKTSSKGNSSMDKAKTSNLAPVIAKARMHTKPVKPVEDRKPASSKNKVQKVTKAVPVVTAPRLKRSTKSTTDLSSKLTAAAAAKRNGVKVSPKKFLRATRATTLVKKESSKNKTGSKGLKGVSKSTGTLLKMNKMDAFEEEVALSPEMEPAVFKPVEVPNILEDFDFSLMNDVRVEEQSSSSADWNHFHNSEAVESGLQNKVVISPLKPRRKSLRRSTRLAVQDMNNSGLALKPLFQTESSDNLIVFTPGPNKRKSMRQSKRMSSVVTNDQFGDADQTLSQTENSDISITFTPGQSRRKSMLRSTCISSVPSQGELDRADQTMSQTENVDILNSVTPGQSKRKSMQRSKRMSSAASSSQFDDVDQTLSQTESPHILITFTPGQSKRISMLKSTLLNASASKNRLVDEEALRTSQDKHLDNLISVTPSQSRRKSRRKSSRVSTSVAKQFERNCKVDSLQLDGGMSSPSPKLAKRKSTRRSKVTTELFEDLQASGDDETQIDEENVMSSISFHDTNGSFYKSPGPITDAVIEEDFRADLVCSPQKSDLLMKDGESDTLSLSLTKQSYTDIPVSTPKRNIMRMSHGTEKHHTMSGSDLILAEMECDTHQPQESEMDTQVPFGDMTSSPKSSHGGELLGSVQSETSVATSPHAGHDFENTSTPAKALVPTPRPHSRRRNRSQGRSSVLRRRSRRSLASPLRTPRSHRIDKSMNISAASTPNSVKNIENIPRLSMSRRNARRSSVIDVSDEGTAVGRELELALAYKVEKPPLSARASQILNELVIEKVDGEKSFFEVSFDELVRESQSDSFNHTWSKPDSISSADDKIPSTSTSPFTPRKSCEVSSQSSTSSPLVTPQCTPSSSRHSMAPLSGFKQPGLPLSALRKSAARRKTACGTPSRTPEQMINILKKSPMVEMTRRRSRHSTCPALPKGQYFRDLIDNEMDRLTSLSNKWNSYLAKETALQEEVLGQIRATVGKAFLLMDQRFKQFSGLVDNYVYDLGEKKTTPTDLQGFWDMIFFQVEDVDAQFKQLDKLRQSNWSVKTATPKQTVKRNVKPKAKPKEVKSKFSAFKAEMQKRKAALATTAPQTDQANFEIDMTS